MTNKQLQDSDYVTHLYDNKNQRGTKVNMCNIKIIKQSGSSTMLAVLC